MKPIIMSAESVRAILDGRKTQTRRVVKPQPSECGDNWIWSYHHRGIHGNAVEIAWFMRLHSPYTVGQRLWVRETWTRARTWTGKPWIYKAELTAEEWARREEIAKRNPPDPSGYVLRWNSPIFMPRRASRITLEVTGVRAERLQDIDICGAVSEGVPPPRREPCGAESHDPVQVYAERWDKLNAKRGYDWESNPWVWVVEFAVAGGDR
jgi:hypothetical protein